MRIAIFTDISPKHLNTSENLERLISYFSRHNISFQLFLPTTHSLTSENQTRTCSFQSFPLNAHYRFSLPNATKIRRRLNEFQPDFIHVLTPFTLGLYGRQYAKRTNLPLIGYYMLNIQPDMDHSNVPFLRSLFDKYVQWFYRPFHKLLVPNFLTKHTLEGNNFPNIAVCSKGVELDVFHPAYERFDVKIKYNIKRPYILTYSGELTAEDNVEAIFTIARYLPPHIKHKVHWLVVGDGPLKEVFQREALEHMTFTGSLQKEDRARVYAASDLMICPSSKPRDDMLLEAFATATPAIVSEAQQSDIVKHGENGFLCNLENLDQFSEYITLCLEHSDLRERLGTMARNHALTKGWDQVFDHLMVHYTQLIEETKRSRTINIEKALRKAP
ncbi:glycosyltransferase [Priestia koreensis]|uniref:Glycosyltransferase subfamily 4-like N-terminal domain-containing protein n=1 Tax=Priestia koreensis TaxID=284581 RepID=A0A0M0L7A3_9BACI|nr:glycosyltransferase [Priestia koreensis]KOO46767.1 hypothetical protein AMD01_07510 [Priestia koreensis]